MARWAWRLFRREWRQQVAVLALLTIATAASVGISVATYNVAPVATTAEFGDAEHFLRFDSTDRRTVAVTLDGAGSWFGRFDVIGHREVDVAGLSNPVDMRSQDPAGRLTAPLLALRSGAYPASAGEVAVTEQVADLFDVGVGDTFDLGGAERTVVGLVENPSDLDDQFALVAPGSVSEAQSMTLFVDATQDRVESFRPPDAASMVISSRGSTPEAAISAVSVLAVAAVAMSVVALVSAASFIVMAQRRQRQLGVLSAVGASPANLRLVTIANGAVIGAVAGVAGAVVGVVGWLFGAPRLEAAVGHRIDAATVPWWLVATGVALTVAASSAAAWWPARLTARVPTVLALSGRPAQPTPVRRSVTLAAALVAVGVGSLALAGGVADDVGIHWKDFVLVAGGTASTVAGVLLLCPLVIRALAAPTGWLPVSLRLPLRDLARHQARSGAALASITLVLGIAAAALVLAASSTYDAEAGNLSDRELLVAAAGLDGPFAPLPADLAELEGAVERLATSLDGAEVVGIDLALDPGAGEAPGGEARQALSLGERFEDGWRDVTPLYVATPEVLALHHVEGPTERFITDEPGDLRILGTASAGPGSGEPERLPEATAIPPGRTSIPGSFVTTEELRRRGWESVPSGRWLFRAEASLTDDQLDDARDLAASSGLAIESRDLQGGLARVRTVATVAGMALALAVLALTVGLIRGEAATELRTLAAAGAPKRIQRVLTATTAGGLALLGALLGIVGAYVVLAAGRSGGFGALTPTPVAQLLVLAFATPTLAAAGGWVLARPLSTRLTAHPLV